MIAEINVRDADGEVSISVAHTVAGDITVSRYDGPTIHLDYEEARSLARALDVLLAEHGPR